MSGQGGVGELSDLPRACGSGGGGGMKGEMELGPAQGECLMGAGEVEEPLSAHLSRKTAIMSQFESKALGLDKAILHSIDCCGKKGRGEVKKGLIRHSKRGNDIGLDRDINLDKGFKRASKSEIVSKNGFV